MMAQEQMRRRHRDVPPFVEGLINDLNAVLWEADPQTFQFTYVSQGAERLLGLPPSAWLEEADFWARHIHPDDRAEAVTQRLLATRDGRDHDFQYRMVAADGSVRWIHDFVRVRVDERGQVTRLSGVLLDTTQLGQAQRMEAIGQLAGGVAHDFNNILTAILAYADLVLEALAPGDARREDVEEIRLAAQRGAELTRQLLAFSRKQVLEAQMVDLNAVVRNSERMLQQLIGEGVVLQLALAPDLGTVLADPGQLEQVIMNLVVNARDAIPPSQPGLISIETANQELDVTDTARHVALAPYVVLAVTDTGTGMDPATKARIFEPFFTTKCPGKGTGLGLSTVYGIVQQSGGHISVYSQVGVGTTMKVYLPTEPPRGT